MDEIDEQVMSEAVRLKLSSDPRKIPEKAMVGELKLRAYLELGNHQEASTFATPLWLSLREPELWFKNYTQFLTEPLLRVFGNHKFKLEKSGVNRAGYYAKFKAEMLTHSKCFELIEELGKLGVLANQVSRKKLLTLRAMAALAQRR